MTLPRFRFYGGFGKYVSALSAFASGRVFRGDDVERLERQIERQMDVPHAICVPQARVGLYLVMKHAVGDGDVAMSPYTIFDVVNMALCAGIKPRFIDIRTETCNMDYDKFLRALDPEVKAVLVTHLHGCVSDIARFREQCAKKGIYLIEDAAQAFGAMVDGRYAGTHGNAGVFSFGRAKNINSFFGGMVVTHDDELARRIRADLSQWPMEDGSRIFKRIVSCFVGDLMTWKPIFNLLSFRIFRYAALHDVRSVNQLVETENNPFRRDALPEAFKRRYTPLQARLALRQIAEEPGATGHRKRLADYYYRELAGINGLQLPELPSDGDHVFLSFPVLVDSRWQVVKHLMHDGVDISIQHIRNAADLEVFSDLHRDCPVARNVSEQVLLLPTYPEYTESEAQKLIRSLRRYLAGDSAFAVGSQ